MKILRYVAFALGGLVALLLVTAVFLVATFDANRFKGEITNVVKQKKDRTLAIEGDLALSFWPDLGVNLGRTTLSEHGSDKEFAALDHVHVSVALMPLLSKRVVVDKVRIEGIKATVIRRKDGTFNFDDLLSKEKQESETVRFDVAGIQVTGGQITFADEKAGQTFNLGGVNLETGRLGNAADGPLNAEFKASSSQPKFNVDVKVSGRYGYDLENKQYALSRLQLQLAGDALGIQALNLSVTAGKLDVKSDQGEVELDNLRLAARGKAGADNFDVSVDAPRLSAGANKASGETIGVSARLTGEQRVVNAKLSLSGVEGSAAALKIANFKLELDARQGKAAVNGRLNSALAANLKMQTYELPKFSGEFFVAHPEMPMKSVRLPLAGNARADLAKSTAAGELSTKFDDSSINAKWSVPKFAPLAATFDVSIDRINIDKYFPPKPRAGKQAASAAGPEKPIDFSAIKGLDLRGTLKIGSLQAQNVKASNLRLTIRATDGKLDINPMAANLYQGKLAGSLSVNANNNQVALKQNLDGVSVNPLMKDAIDKDLIEGRGKVALDIVTAGTTVTSMKKGLSGTARMALRDGAIKGINLAKTFREWKARINMKQDAIQQASKIDKTDVSELTASFRIAHGVAHNSDLAAKSPFLRLGGAGDIDIGAGSLDYLLKASVVGTSGGQAGKELAQLKGVTVPVRVTGPFDRLAFQVQFAELATELIKGQVDAKIQEQKERLQQKAQEKIQEQLKGFFGR
jgi:AsmA protein